MANLRSASACVRLLTPPPSQTGSQWRTASPNRWSRTCVCQRHQMSTVQQQMYQNHTDSKNTEQKEEKIKEVKSKASYVDTLRDQIKYVERMKAGKFQKYVPFAMKVKEKVQNDIQGSIEEQKEQLRKLERRVKDRMMAYEAKTGEKADADSFEKAMQETNESIEHYYDTFDSTNLNANNKNIVQAKTVNEDDLMTSIFKSVWSNAKEERDVKEQTVPVKKKPFLRLIHL